MKVDMLQVGNAVFPILKTIGAGILIIGGTSAFAWYWFIYRRRKRWQVNIWERKADGRLHLIDKDVLTAKKINKGKSRIYVLKWANAECMPPPWEATYRLRGKEYCDYLRIEDDYLPINRKLNEEFTDKKEKFIFIYAIRRLLKRMKSLSASELEERYIYLPIENTLATTIQYEPLDYDVNMMRINAIDNLDSIFKDKESFMQKYGAIISFGLIAGVLLLTMYFSYDFAKNIIAQALGAADKVAQPLASLAEKIGGTPPPG